MLHLRDWNSPNGELPLHPICMSNHMFKEGDLGKFPECVFENFEMTRVKRGQCRHFQKSQW